MALFRDFRMIENPVKTIRACVSVMQLAVEVNLNSMICSKAGLIFLC